MNTDEFLQRARQVARAFCSLISAFCRNVLNRCRAGKRPALTTPA